MGIRDVKQALVGDTFYHTNQPVVPMKGFSQPTSMVSIKINLIYFMTTPGKDIMFLHSNTFKGL